jgi:uncharacterized membrane protein YphA (DoxX/SURF4 family)
MWDLWFAPSDPRALACCRILIFWSIWPGFVPRDFDVFVRARSFVWEPVSFFDTLGVPLLGTGALNAMSTVHALAAAAAMLGVFYRPAAVITAVLGLYLNAISQNFGKINHNNNLLTLAPFVFACARAADAWSVDAWLQRRRGRDVARVPSGAYRWPIQFVALLIANMYMAAGLSKLWRTGLEWSDVDRFARLLLRHHFTHDPPTRLGVTIADHPLLCAAFAKGALLLELSAPLSLLGRVPRALILWSLGLLQLGIWIVMGVGFAQMVPLFACLLPWQQLVRLVDRVSRRSKHVPSPTQQSEQPEAQEPEQQTQQ